MVWEGGGGGSEKNRLRHATPEVSASIEAHTNALAEAERAAIAQIEGIADANTLASSREAETIDLAPLYAAKDKAQTRYDEAVKEFEKQVQEYEKQWIAAYDYLIADDDSKPNPPWSSSYYYWSPAPTTISVWNS